MELGAVLAWECKGPILIFITASLSCLFNLGLDQTICMYKSKHCVEQKICVQAGLLHRANGIVLEADFFIFWYSLFSPMYRQIPKEESTKQRFTDMLFTQSWCLQFTKSTCWRYGRVTLWSVLHRQYLTWVFLFWNLIFSDVSLLPYLRGRSLMLVYFKDMFY